MQVNSKGSLAVRNQQGIDRYLLQQCPSATSMDTVSNARELREHFGIEIIVKVVVASYRSVCTRTRQRQAVDIQMMEVARQVIEATMSGTIAHKVAARSQLDLQLPARL